MPTANPRLYTFFGVCFLVLGTGLAVDLVYTMYHGGSVLIRSVVEILGQFLLAWFFLQLRAKDKVEKT